MKYQTVFDIIGPVMIGPSSSHTAGAARIGRVARALLGCLPERAEITLYGSFAQTYRGHGTDIALVGGLLSMAADDPALPNSFAHAEEANVEIALTTSQEIPSHPNTARLHLHAGEKSILVEAASLGGGTIELREVEGFALQGFSCVTPTLFLFHQDQPGVVAQVTTALAAQGINIAKMQVARKMRGAEALIVAEMDGATEDLGALLAPLPSVRRLILLG